MTDTPTEDVDPEQGDDSPEVPAEELGDDEPDQ